MEKLVAELKKILPLKSTTAVGDIVIVAGEEPQFVTYAVVTKIERDDTRKQEWWHLTMQFLSVPPQQVTWTLRTPQFTGEETFTMGGNGRFIQALDFAPETSGEVPPLPETENKLNKHTENRPGIRRIK